MHYPKEDDGEHYTACLLIKGLRGIEPRILYPKEESGSHCLLILDLKPHSAGLKNGSTIIGIIAGLIVRRGNDAKVGLGCGLMFPIALAVFITLQLILPDVVVVSNVNGQLSHDTKTLISSIETPSGQSSQLSLCNKYVANFSDETLILYPEYYGPTNKAKSVKAEDPIIIEPNTVIRIKETPDYYFSPAATQISSKSNNVEVRWVLETLRSVAEREGFDYEE